MQYGYAAVEVLARSLYSALLKDLPDTIEPAWIPPEGSRATARPERRRRPTEMDVEVFMFPQGWSSTALGFGGIGGQAMTSAYTVIVSNLKDWAVYFNGRLAYVITNPTIEFMEDLRNHNMAEVGKTGGYQRKDEK